MDKLYSVLEPIFTRPQDVPKPPVKEEFANYDPKVEPPMWSWSRLRYGVPQPDEIPDRPKQSGGLPDSDDKPDWRGVIKNNVIPLEPEKEYDFGQPEYKKYYFFDTPDHADPFKKLWFSFKFFVRSGGIIACSVAIMRNMPTNMASYKSLWQGWFAPWVIGGMSASTTVVTVANLRGRKDDYWNYAAAGAVAGWATCRGKWITHMNNTVTWSVGALTMKYVNEHNLVLLPTMNFGSVSMNLHGNSGEAGLASGNFQFTKGMPDDPGRDGRRHAY